MSESKNLNCVNCGSDQAFGWVRLSDVGQLTHGSYDHAIYFERNPRAPIFKGVTFAKVKAIVCGQCGHISFFAENPAEFVAQLRLQDE